MDCGEAAARLVGLLNELDAWIDDIPPQESPQRFGNLAFRTWGKRLEEVRVFAPLSIAIITTADLTC